MNTQRIHIQMSASDSYSEEVSQDTSDSSQSSAAEPVLLVRELILETLR